MASHLRSDPAVADWYFTRRFELFLKYYFRDHMKCTDWYFRVEYQHRGSPHVHGLLWLANAPNVTQAPIDLVAAAAYADKHISAMNPRGDVDSVPRGAFLLATHPASVPYAQVPDYLKDYSDLINTCMRHTRCQEGRCIRMRTLANGKREFVCRYGFPKPHQDKTVCRFDVLPVKDSNKKNAVATAPAEGEEYCVLKYIRILMEYRRNESLVATHSPSMLSAWRANCEMQLIVHLDAVRRYVVKYLTKGEPVSSYLKLIREMATSTLNSWDSSKRAVQSIILATVGCRDYSAQECAHHLLQLPLFFCTRIFETVNTSGLRCVDGEGAMTNNLDRYAKRHPELENVTLFEFVKTYANNKPVGTLPSRRRLEAIVVVKPRL